MISLHHNLLHQEFPQMIYSNLFSSVAHVWAPGAKTTGLIAKKFGFS
jgi:hypothetical protein